VVPALQVADSVRDVMAAKYHRHAQGSLNSQLLVTLLLLLVAKCAYPCAPLYSVSASGACPPSAVGLGFGKVLLCYMQ
jgi:hypothetical protein